jgi:hypothetical protein
VRFVKSVALANNKYGQAVAVALKMDHGEGLVIILPDIHDKPSFLLGLLQEVLPELLPELFPHAEGGRWVYRPEYELPGVRELQDQITTLQQDTEKKVVALRGQIKQLQEKGTYTYDLLRETGAPLVAAVKQALAVLGFQSITDVDEQIKQEGQGKQLREDLQIHDRSPTLIVDVKGVQGLPSDSEALQAQKHAHIRMVEWERTDVRSLTIINHQRHVPALQRENRMPFRQEILDAAQPNLGLITTWDLFRLVRSYLRNGWRPDHVLPLFYQNGRIYPIPVHYQYLGIVEHTWKEALSVQVQQGEFAVGDRIAFELPVDFEEQNVTSLQLDDREVQKAKAGDIIGVFTGPRQFSVKKGMRVFRVGQA